MTSIAPASVDEPAPPWRRTAAALAVSQTVIWAGLYYGFAALLPHWQAGLGWSAAQLTGAMTLALVLSALGSPLAGRLIDRGHGRALMAGCATLGGACLLALTQVATASGFYLIYIGIGVAMAGCLYDACFGYLTRAFPQQARRAITWVTLVAGFAGTLSFPLGHAIAEAYGWRAAPLAYAGLILLVGVPLIALAAPQRASVPYAAATRAAKDRTAAHAALRLPAFWLLTLAFTMVALTHSMIITLILPLLAAREVPAATAVLVASSIGPMQVAGRIGMLVVERFVPFGMVAGATFVALILASAALFTTSGVSALLIAFAVLQGAGYGITSIARPVLLADRLGHAGFGAINGTAGLFFTGAMAAAPSLGAGLVLLGGYDLMLGACLAGAVIGLVVLIAALRR